MGMSPYREAANFVEDQMNHQRQVYRYQLAEENAQYVEYYKTTIACNGPIEQPDTPEIAEVASAQYTMWFVEEKSFRGNGYLDILWKRYITIKHDFLDDQQPHWIRKE